MSAPVNQFSTTTPNYFQTTQQAHQQGGLDQQQLNSIMAAFQQQQAGQQPAADQFASSQAAAPNVSNAYGSPSPYGEASSAATTYSPAQNNFTYGAPTGTADNAPAYGTTAAHSTANYGFPSAQAAPTAEAQNPFAGYGSGGFPQQQPYQLSSGTPENQQHVGA